MTPSENISTVATERRETHPEAEPENLFESSSRGVTPRVVFLSLLLAAFFGLTIPIIDVKMSNTYLGSQHLPVGALASLMVLLLVINPFLRVLARRFVLVRNELLTIYITCLFSCLVPGRGAENYFVSNMVGGFYYATPENGWMEILKTMQPWLSPVLWVGNGALTPQGEAIARGWYEGLAPNLPIPWGAWLVPVAAWSSLILATYVMLGCLSVMLRAQWGEREHLAFPLLRLPLEMTRDADDPNARAFGSFFRNPAMWVGFAIAAFAQGINGLRSYFPDVPAFPLSLDTAALFTETPWNQMGPTVLQIFPIALGVAFLLTSEVSFSLWACFWLFKLQYILAYYLGWMPATLPDTIGWAGVPAKTFTGYQQMGAYVAYVGVALWTARKHLAHIAKRAFGKAASTREEKSEALSYPVAFWGFVAGLIFVIGWSVAAGIRLDIALALWTFYLLTILALTRIIAESGMLYVQQGFTPLGTFAQMAGSGQGAWLAGGSLLPAAMIQLSMVIDLRANLMPSFVQGLKLAHDRKISARPLLLLIGATTLLSFAIGVWMYVRMGYRSGGALTFHATFAQYIPQQSPTIAKQLSAPVAGMSATNWAWLGLGGAFTYAAMWARGRFAWFPLHPIGLLLGLTHPMFTLWFSIFLGWLCKVSITRFGGPDAYRKAVPLFLGLALGDIFMMLFWIVIDGWQGRVGRILLPG